MTQTTRIVIGIVVLVVIVGAVLGIDALRRQNSSTPVVYGQQALAPGSIPI
jgi:hypothetical protein